MKLIVLCVSIQLNDDASSQHQNLHLFTCTNKKYSLTHTFRSFRILLSVCDSYVFPQRSAHKYLLNIHLLPTRTLFISKGTMYSFYSIYFCV